MGLADAAPWLTEALRADARKFVDEYGGTWDKIPGDIAEASAIHLLVAIDERLASGELPSSRSSLDDVTATQIGQWLGVIGENGDWL